MKVPNNRSFWILVDSWPETDRNVHHCPFSNSSCWWNLYRILPGQHAFAGMGEISDMLSHIRTFFCISSKGQDTESTTFSAVSSLLLLMMAVVMIIVLLSGSCGRDQRRDREGCDDISCQEIGQKGVLCRIFCDSMVRAVYFVNGSVCVCFGVLPGSCNVGILTGFFVIVLLIKQWATSDLYLSCLADRKETIFLVNTSSLFSSVMPNTAPPLFCNKRPVRLQTAVWDSTALVKTCQLHQLFAV